MARRRLNARPLLVATGTMMVLGCGGLVEPPPPPGNPMPPPMFAAEICVDATPADALVELSEVEVLPGEPGDRCQSIRTEGGVRIQVSAPGYETVVLRPMQLKEGENVFKTKLPDGPAPPPVGNLMAPPRTPKDVGSSR